MGQFEDLGKLITSANGELEKFSKALTDLETEDGEPIDLDMHIRKIVNDELDARFPKEDADASLPLDDTISEQSIGYDFNEGNTGIQASLSSARIKPITNLMSSNTDRHKFINDDQDMGDVQQPTALEILKSSLADVASKANDAMNRVSSVSGEINQVRADTNQAKSIAMKALSKAGSCSCKPANPAVSDSDAETPSYVREGPQ